MDFTNALANYKLTGNASVFNEHLPENSYASENNYDELRDKIYKIINAVVEKYKNEELLPSDSIKLIKRCIDLADDHDGNIDLAGVIRIINQADCIRKVVGREYYLSLYEKNKSRGKNLDFQIVVEKIVLDKNTQLLLEMIDCICDGHKSFKELRADQKKDLKRFFECLDTFEYEPGDKPFIFPSFGQYFWHPLKYGRLHKLFYKIYREAK